MAAETDRAAAITTVRRTFQSPVTGKMTVLGGKDDARATRRFKIFKQGQYLHEGASSAIHLLDISSFGARAHAEKMPKRGDHVLIECGFSLGTANVLWISPNRFGLEFTNPLNDEMLSRILKD